MDPVDAMTLTMRQGLAVGLVVLGVLSGQQVSWAQSENSQPVENPPALPRLSASLTGVVGVSFGLHIASSTEDTATVLQSQLLSGLRLALRGRVSDHWAFGLSAGKFFIGALGGVNIRWWDAQFSTRYFLGQPSVNQYWTELGLGLAAATEAVPAYDVYGGGHVLAHSNVIWAPAASLAIGKDVAIGRYLGIAPEIRGMYLGFSNDALTPVYGPQKVILLGLSLNGLGAYL